jgi:hypothetical protein
MAFAQNIEQWRLVDGYNNYEISSHGRARNNVTGRILSQYDNNMGYYIVSLCKDGIQKTHKIHRLVAFAFCENPNNLTVVDHIDRNRTNNMFNNLRWCTSSENNRNISIKSNNRSGTTGVHKLKTSWQAQWYDNEGTQRSKCFSIKKFGDEEAKELAIAHRKAKELEFGYL